MVDQSLVNAAIAAGGAAVSFILKRVFDEIDRMNKREQVIAEKLNNIEVLIAGNYIRREQFDSAMRMLETKLDRLDEKLSRKVDLD